MEKKEGESSVDNCPEAEERTEKSGKKQREFDGLKKWKRRDLDDETVPLSLIERSDNEDYLPSYHISTKTCGEGPESDTNLMKNKLNSRGSPYDQVLSKLCKQPIIVCIPEHEVIKEMTDGGADYCFEYVGMASLVEEAYASCRKIT